MLDRSFKNPKEEHLSVQLYVYFLCLEEARLKAVLLHDLVHSERFFYVLADLECDIIIAFPISKIRQTLFGFLNLFNDHWQKSRWN